jgi:hypothetical protein
MRLPRPAKIFNPNIPLLCDEGWRDSLTEAGAPGSHPLLCEGNNILEYKDGEIVKSDKSPSQIRNFEIADWTRLSEVQSEISDLGFKMQDSSDFKIPSHR